MIHEIDILASKLDETIACECKSGNQKPNKHLIADWESTCRDFQFNAKPAIASESGFTYYGLLYAKAYNVILIEKVKQYPYQQVPNLEIIDLTEIKSQT